MIDWPLIFLGGVLGSGHCVGMCGAFALAIGWNADTPRKNCISQMVYSVGRCLTYVFLGTVAGFCGQQLRHGLPMIANVQGWISIVAGQALVATGLVSTGWIPSSERWLKNISSCAAATHFRNLLRSGQAVHVFLAGVATGFLPCGLVYAFLALAISSAHLHTGAVIMLAFGLGTVPLMIFTCLGSSLVGIENRQRLVRFAAYSVILTGCLAIARGVSGIATEAETSIPCPLCVAR